MSTIHTAAADGETRILPRKRLPFEDVASITRRGKVFRVRASGEEYVLAIEDLETGKIEVTCTEDKEIFHEMLAHSEAGWIFFCQCIVFLSTWTPTAPIGGTEED